MTLNNLLEGTHQLRAERWIGARRGEVFSVAARRLLSADRRFAATPIGFLAPGLNSSAVPPESGGLGSLVPCRPRAQGIRCLWVG